MSLGRTQVFGIDDETNLYREHPEPLPGSGTT